MAGRIDPLSDLDIVNTELALADLAVVDKALDRASKAAKSGSDKDAVRRRELFERARALLNRGAPARALQTRGEEERRDLRELQLLTAKPVMYLSLIHI